MLKRLRTTIVDLRFDFKNMETSYKQFQQEFQEKLFFFLSLSILIVHIILLIVSLYYKQGGIEIITRSVTLLFSLIACIISKRYGSIQKIILLGLLIFWENHVASSLHEIGETNLDLAYVLGDMFGIVEMMFALAAKDLRLRFVIHLAAGVGKLSGLWHSALSQTRLFFIIPSTAVIAFIFCLSHEILDRNNFRQIFASKEKLKKFQSLLSKDFPSSVLIMTADFKTTLYSNELFQSNFTLPNTLPNISDNTEEVVSTLFQSFTIEKDKSDASLDSGQEITLADYLKTLSNRDEIAQGIESITLVAIYTNKQGCQEHFEIKLRKILWDGKRSYALVFNDISDKQKAANLKLIDEQKDRVIATVSHELRTPINGIMGLLEMARARIDDQVSITFLDHCKSCSKLLLYLVNSILDLSQLRHNSLRIVKETFFLDEFLEELKSLYLFQCQQKGIEFIVDVSPQVPLRIYTDKYRLIEILINLLGNAMKFTFKGSIKLTISIEKNDRKKLYFCIQDTGIGIKDEDKPKLFKMFGKITHANKNINAQGAGLGLTIASELVQALNHEGSEERIEFSSEYGQGSVFWFRIDALPMASAKKSWITPDDSFEILIDSMQLKEHSSTGDLSSPKRNIRVYNPPKNNLREMINDYSFHLKEEDITENLSSNRVILSPELSSNRHILSPQLLSPQFENTQKEVLIVDDNPFNLMAASFVVEKLGFTTTKAFNGQECLESLEDSVKNNKRYSLIITDIQMPVLDGLEMSKIISQKIKTGEMYNVPIVALTATTLGKKEKKMYKECGIAYSLEKPLIPEVVKATLESLFQQNNDNNAYFGKDDSR